MTSIQHIMRLTLLTLTGAASVGLTAGGCGSDTAAATTAPSAAVRKQDDALRDPMNYGPGKDFGSTQPTVEDSNPAKTSAKEDWNRFWNP